MTASTYSSHLAYRVIKRTGASAILRRLGSGATVFCFHNVVPDEHVGRGDSSLHMPVGHFASIVTWIGSTYRVVPLSELAERLRAGRSVRGLAALTSDDAYRGFIDHGLPVLGGLDLPATLFVVPTAAEKPTAFWWDRLASVGRLSDETRAVHLSTHRGSAQEILDTLPERATAEAPAVPRPMLPAAWSDIQEALTSHRLVEIGSHTLTHRNLTRLSVTEMAHEMDDSRNAISERLGMEVSAISYPYGLHDETVTNAARRSGYLAGYTLAAGSASPSQDPLATPRLNVPATIGVEALECWASGMRPRGRS